MPMKRFGAFSASIGMCGNLIVSAHSAAENPHVSAHPVLAGALSLSFFTALRCSHPSPNHLASPESAANKQLPSGLP